MPTSWRDAASLYLDRRVLSILLFGFSSGLPLLLVGGTLSAWLREADVSKTAIGFISLVGMAYGLKFVWSPLVDRMPIPVLTRLLGRRRSWLLLSQCALIATIAGLAGTDPSTADGLRATIGWAVAVAFASATQDIAVDAYRTEILTREKLGAGAANIQLGYRVGTLAAGGGALILADVAGWSVAYLVMAGLVLVGMITTLVNPEPSVPEAVRSPAPAGPVPVAPRARQMLDWLQTAVVDPFADFARRPGWLAVLLFVGLYRYGDSLLGVMANPFYIEMGFTKSEIGLVSKGFGLGMTLAGTVLGGLLYARLGMAKSLMVGGLLQGGSNLVFAVQAMVGHSVPMLSVTIAVENLSGGIAAAAFVAYLSSLCNIAYTATQYALLSSLAAFSGRVLASVAGWMADQVSWEVFFVLTTLAAIPGLAMLFWMTRRFPPEPTRQ